MKCPFKILAIDLDGTLLDSGNELSDENRRALHRAHKAGLTVCLTTGRCYTEAKPVINAIGLDLDVAVTVFGAIVSDARTGRTLIEQPIAPGTLDRICTFLADRDLSLTLLHDATAVGVDYSIMRMPRWCEGYDRWFKIVSCELREVDHWRSVTEPVYRVGIIETPDFFRTIEPDVHEALPPEVAGHNAIYVPPSDMHVLEFFAPQVNKWSALQQLCRERGVPEDEVAAIGDAINDLEMIQGAGRSFAMANGDERIKRLADHLVPSNDENGVAQAIRMILGSEA